jgi:6-phospho-beta-glucosidase
MKIAVVGCGLRTPLLAHGLARSGLPISELTLFDVDAGRTGLMAALAAAIAAGSGIQIAAAPRLEEALEGAAFVVSSIRVGGMEARARDERLIVNFGFAGQETTGPGGLAMALRTVPVVVEHARLVQRYAPGAWIINFTNPAGLITQAIRTHTGARAVGICDTPAELFFRIALALGTEPGAVECDYFGLNHLGWVRSVRLGGQEVLGRLLADPALLRRLYPAELFAPALLRALGLLPSEYLFFYYRQRAAWQNQVAAGATRGEEILQLNDQVLSGMARDAAAGELSEALQKYRAYLNRRNASYLRLEAARESAWALGDLDWDPFEGATGYHRIAVEAIRALCRDHPSRMVLNVPNQGTLAELAAEDVVEAPCLVDRSGPRPLPAGPLPEAVRGLVTAVKAYERLAIRAALEKSGGLAALALFVNPIVNDWQAAQEIVGALVTSDPEYLGYLAGRSPVLP